MLFEINHVDKNKEKGYYMVDLKDKVQIKIVTHNHIIKGRTQDCDIKLHDISVSRHHATIFINALDHEFFIEDNCSKFGTLILGTSSLTDLATNNELTIPVLPAKELIQKKIALQAGRIVVIVTVERKNKKLIFTK